MAFTFLSMQLATFLFPCLCHRCRLNEWLLSLKTVIINTDPFNYPLYSPMPYYSCLDNGFPPWTYFLPPGDKTAFPLPGLRSLSLIFHSNVLFIYQGDTRKGKKAPWLEAFHSELYLFLWTSKDRIVKTESLCLLWYYLCALPGLVSFSNSKLVWWRGKKAVKKKEASTGDGHIIHG